MWSRCDAKAEEDNKCTVLSVLYCVFCNGVRTVRFIVRTVLNGRADSTHSTGGLDSTHRSPMSPLLRPAPTPSSTVSVSIVKYSTRNIPCVV